MLMGHVVRVGADHRAVEQSLALPRSLFHEELELPGAVLDATFAVRRPALLDQLRQRGVPFAVDPEALRFGSGAYRDVNRLVALPYAPTDPITSDTTNDGIRAFVVGALQLQAEAGAAVYMAPSVPLDDSADALRLNARLASAARDALGGEVDRRPLVITISPSTRALRDPAPLARVLADLVVDEVHVQPLRFRPTELGVATLDRYCDYLASIQSLGVPVMAGRVGAFGLVLLALGIDAFDSGLTTAEAFDLNSAIRSARARQRHNAAGEPSGGGRKRRFYLTQLKTTVMAPVIQAIDTPELRFRFTSSLPCCTAGFGGYLEHSREHCLFARSEEARTLQSQPTAMRAAVLAAQLAEARDHGAVLSRGLDAQGVRAPSFDHLERWRRLLIRRSERVEAA